MGTVTPNSPQDRFEVIVEALLDYGGRVHRGVWIARDRQQAKVFCPVHNDRNNPSLSVRIKSSGEIATTCHAMRCERFDVLAAVGLPSTIVYPNATRSSAARRTPARDPFAFQHLKGRRRDR